MAYENYASVIALAAIGPFENRTSTLLAVGILALLGTAVFVVLALRRRQLKGTVDEQFRIFREKALTLMDQLDRLKKRHATLASDDPDFTAPLAGSTLELYSEVDADLKRLWERWLGVMEHWERAKQLVQSSTVLAPAQMTEAKAVLEQDDIDDLLHQSRSCKERLDRLNGGHEEARHALKAARHEFDAFQAAVSREAGEGQGGDRLDEEVASASTMLGMAESMIPADPIGAAELITRARRSISEALTSPAHGHREQDGSAKAKGDYSLIDELAEAVERLRAAAARIRVADILGLLVRFWILLWAFALIGGIFTLIVPVALFLAGPLLFLAFCWIAFKMIGGLLGLGFWRLR